jgi:hypothetical protein
VPTDDVPRVMRVVCVDGPLAGAQTTCPRGTHELTLHDQTGTAVRYHIDGLLSGFPGEHYAARFEMTGLSSDPADSTSVTIDPA